VVKTIDDDDAFLKKSGDEEGGEDGDGLSAFDTTVVNIDDSMDTSVAAEFAALLTPRGKEHEQQEEKGQEENVNPSTGGRRLGRVGELLALQKNGLSGSQEFYRQQRLGNIALMQQTVLPDPVEEAQRETKEVTQEPEKKKERRGKKKPQLKKHKSHRHQRVRNEEEEERESRTNKKKERRKKKKEQEKGKEKEKEKDSNWGTRSEVKRRRKRAEVKTDSGALSLNSL